MALAFTRAYARARQYLHESSAAEVTTLIASWFPNTDRDALQHCIESYQQLGCWTPHVSITREAFDVIQDVFQHVDHIQQRYPYESICAAPHGGIL